MTDSSAGNVVVIGSGAGGLSTAIILSKLGFHVNVVEKNPRPGGLMRSYFRKGVECEVGVHYLGALAEGQVLRKLFDFLGVTSQIPVKRMGQNGVIDRYLFDSFAFDLPEGLDAFEANLLDAFPKETRQIADVMGRLRNAAEKLNSLDFLFSDRIDLSMIDSKPFGAILADAGCSPELRAILGVPAHWIGVRNAICPSFYHNTALVSYLMSSWRLECGGSAMADAFAGRLMSLGGNIVCGDGADEILVNDRTVRGVRLKSGMILNAGIVVAAVHPKVVLSMLPDGAVTPAYKKRVSNLEDTEGLFCVQAVFDSQKAGIPHNLFKVGTDSAGNISDSLYFQARKTGREGKCLLTILTSGKYGMWRPWENTRTGHRGEKYAETKRKEAERMLNAAGKLMGPLRGLELLDAYTPLTIRDWVNTPGGSAYGVLKSSKQMLSAAILNRTPVKNLYLAGQSVMAPGILGTLIGSLATVKFILGADRFRDAVSLG